MGGRISILYGGAHPDRVERIVLNDIGPALDPAALANLNRWAGNAPSEFNTIDDVLAYYRSIGFGPRDDGEFRNIVKWLVKPMAGGRLTWKMDPAISKPPPGQSSVRSDGYWDEFRRIDSPILIVRGALSDILTPEIAVRMCEAGHDVRMVVVPGVGHAPSLGEPESLAAIHKFFGLES
jgi:pimeloyl-ACP methyl ester carboxylesterase